MFEFTLRDLDHIQPWGPPDAPVLHWFGLTDGNYFIDVGTAKLLAYAPRLHWPVYVDYQIARFHEDLLDMAPETMSPIPSNVVEALPNNSLLQGLERLRFLACENEEVDEPLVDALEGFRLRKLHTAHLTPGSDIAIWRHEDNVVVEWDNRSRLVDGTFAWAAIQGSVCLSPAAFVAHVRRFHEEFLDAMAKRIEAIRGGFGRPGVAIDIGALDVEQQRRRSLLELAFCQAETAIPWEVVLDGLKRLSEISFECS